MRGGNNLAACFPGAIPDDRVSGDGRGGCDSARTRWRDRRDGGVVGRARGRDNQDPREQCGDLAYRESGRRPVAVSYPAIAGRVSATGSTRAGTDRVGSDRIGSDWRTEPTRPASDRTGSGSVRESLSGL